MSRFPVVAGRPDGSVVVRLSGEIDLMAVPRLTKCLDAVTGGAAPRVVLDLRQVTFIDCRGLSVLVRARRRVCERQGALALAGAGPAIVRTLRAVGLLGVFPVHPDVAAAAASLAPPVPHSA